MTLAMSTSSLSGPHVSSLVDSSTPPSGVPSVTNAYIDPSQMIHDPSQAGASSSAQGRRKMSSNGKRRRATTPEESGDSSSQQQRKNRDGPKKKKANRACAHCQKAHLTCDDSRPCQRCIKRGIASSCTEGHRKKAKYLLDDEELERLKSQSSVPEKSSEPAQPPPLPTSEPFQANDPLFNVSFDPNFTFGSEAANLEYSILSAILGNPSPPDSGTAPSPPQPHYTQNVPSSAWSPEPLPPSQYGPNPNTNEFGSPFGEQAPLVIPPSETTLSSRTSPTYMSNYSPSQLQPLQDHLPELQYPANYHEGHSQSVTAPHPLQPRYPRHGMNSGSTGYIRAQSKEAGPHSLVSSSSSRPSPTPSNSVPYNTGDQPSSINVTAPYDYTEGYHFLMKHLPTRFEKNDILRIVRALAIFRPSLIALQMPMTDEDEVFVERCFQRSLLELEKLISYSGTPTVVWRRTGEICLVAPEFCMLTEWAMDELVGRRKYIYELFENQSVVEYWENFASHAFENTTKSVYSHCVLLKPSGAPMPATFCFSIRRDIFDLPSIVIGQWLPLL
ncbi:hypothetical protein BJ138DRAFT_1149410 [Hygrophoropsis aurantiaca]|uniref:Uncharacterized protein n=1 Tax=Hygrophoropsis aurantiaca TaxID=72124 RepID=A0ACB8AFL9_9AGAM|nr:hypothetical protein BJ138DRAFT_1149410 [Hygrophoropsis aurantiaca]